MSSSHREKNIVTKKKYQKPTIFVRIDETVKQDFFNRCVDYKVPHPEMLREMIVAFNENRLTISIPPTQLRIIKGIHHVD